MITTQNGSYQSDSPFQNKGGVTAFSGLETNTSRNGRQINVSDRPQARVSYDQLSAAGPPIGIGTYFEVVDGQITYISPYPQEVTPPTEPPTTMEPTTFEPTTEPPTTEPPTTMEPTTEPPTTNEPTTEPPTNVPTTTVGPTTEPPTTQPPTTAPPTTEPPTTNTPTPPP